LMEVPILFDRLKIILVKLMVKAVVFPSWLVTRIWFGWRDPTKILVTLETNLQRHARGGFEKSAWLRTISAQVKVLIVIPFRDRWDMTERCINSLCLQNLSGIEATLVLVDNGSNQEATKVGLQSVANRSVPKELRVSIIRDDRPYNFSALNNHAVRQFTEFAPDVLCFLNNDIEIETVDAIGRMARFAAFVPDAGAIGCTLIYPSRMIQHLFLAPGVKIVAAHPGRGIPFRKHYAWVHQPRPVAGVTGASLVMRSELFQAVGGFDEKLANACQDIDLCLKLQKSGAVNWSLPDIVMIHHECATRAATHRGFEVEEMYRKWKDDLHWNDYYSSRISRWSETPFVALLPIKFPWQCYRTEHSE
jgi:O-antigen biosynthesis protein